MNGLLEAAQEFQDFFTQRGWRFCFVGGLAVLRWGRPRATQDIDIELLTGFGGEGPYVQALLGRFRSRLPDAAAFARESRTLLLEASNGVPADVAFGAVPFEEKAVERASFFEFLPGVSLRTCSAEDIVVFKAFAARPIDWFDIEGILAKMGDQLDWDYILEELRPLCEAKEEPGNVARLEDLRRNIPGQPH